MALLTKLANDIFSAVDAAGHVRSVDNQDAQRWGTEVEVIINAFASGGGIIYAGKSALDADLSPVANAMAWVLGDPVAGNNGIYRKVGGAGSGAWVRLGDLPYSFIIAADGGAGTSNAIKATTSIPVSASALVWMNVFRVNLGSPVTVSFNGGPTLTIKTRSGEDVAPGGLTPGIIIGVMLGSTFRLFSDEAIASLLYAARDQAIAAANQAVPAAATALAKASEAVASATVAAQYANAAGISKVFASKADADAGLVGVADNAFVQVLVDETEGDVQTVYQKISGAYVLKVKQGRKDVRPEYFGALVDDVTDDRAAVEAARSWLLANGGQLVLTGSKGVFVGIYDPPLDLSGIAVYAEEGAYLRGNIDIHTTTLPITPVALDRQDTANIYTRLWLNPVSMARPEQNARTLGEGDIDRTIDVAINCFNLNHQRINWDGGSDIWENVSPFLVSAELVGYQLTNDGYFYGDFTPARGGDELSTAFDPGNYTRAAALKTTHGVIIAYCQTDGDMTVATKLFGQAATVEAGISWTGKVDHASWLPSKSSWGIRIDNPTSYSIMMNGRVILGPRQLSAGQFITEHGFVTKATGAITSVARKWVLTRGKKTSGRGFIDLLIVGDSTSAAVFGDWPSAMRSRLEGSFGLSVRSLLNIAQDGATTQIQLGTLQATNIAGVSDVCILLGTNDVQNPGAAGDLDACLGYMGQIVDLLQAANKRVSFGIMPMWYAKSLTPNNTGSVSFNYDVSSIYRQSYRYLAASKGCRIVDLNQDLKSALAYDLPGGAHPGVLDPGLRDNIHETALRNLFVADAFARLIAGWWPEKTRAIEAVALPPSFFKNSWTASTTFTPMISMSPDGRVSLAGAVHAGVQTDGAVILQLPTNMRPIAPHFFIGRTSNNTPFRLNLSGSGEFMVFDISGDPAGTEVFLDQVSWQTG